LAGGSAQKAPDATHRPYAVRVSLLIPTHALPPLSYRIPERSRSRILVGSAVVAPLSGRQRLGIVVGFERERDHAREDVLSVVPDLSLSPDLVKLCLAISDNAAVPLPTALRAALPPGIDAGRYRVLRPIPDHPWETGSTATRTALKRALGPDGLREEESRGRIILSPSAPQPRAVEWAVIRAAADPDLSRAPRQRDLFVTLKGIGGSSPTSALLGETGASRSALRELVRRGAVRLVRRPEPTPLVVTKGDAAPARPFARTATGAVRNGGAFLWRITLREEREAVAAIVAATLRDGKQALVLVPEVRSVGRLVEHLRRVLPAGQKVGAYHGGLGRGRTAVYEAARDGAVDVVVGTRTAALLGLARLGSICVVDEPNDAHRAEPGHEGLPVHVRDVTLERSRVDETAVFFLSPFPSLQLYAPEVRRRELVRELPASQPGRWPAVRIVDMRDSGAALSSTLIEACRRCIDRGGRAGLVLRRLGYAPAVACSHCGTMKLCPNCDLPLVLHRRSGPLVCTRCGYREKLGPCSHCGSDRVRPTGLGVERVRDELSGVLGTQVGLITADERDHADAPLVVGTAPRILDVDWDAVILPDADAFLGASNVGAAERAFRLFYRAGEVARGLLLVQTRLPEHYALRAGVRGDYEAFAGAELPRLRSLAYPPFGHFASLTFGGSESAVLGAVESRLRPALGPEVEMSSPVPLGRAGGRIAWRVLLRSRGRPAVARAAAKAARAAARTHGLTVRVELDQEV
jgi:primosomal protein N' (replication factor Y) (superfamily II helicase)